jgi:Fe-S oxidoreductase
VAEWGSRLAPLSNWVMNSAPSRFAAEAMAGVDRRRKLPQFARRSLRKDTGCNFSENEKLHPVSFPILFADTFTNYYDPHIGRAALAVMKAAGVDAGLVPHGCCGRPQISKGLLSSARDTITANTDALYPHAAAGRPIVFCEPSCLSAVREDAPSLLRDEARARAEVVAGKAVLFEEFMTTVADRLPLRAGPANIILHGHCHQKSMGLVPPAKALLSRIPGATVTDLDAGCCGMAGSFGYTRDHYDVSQAIGERRLFPAVRGAAPGTAIVAAGTSCRHQVRDFTGADPLHPAVLLQSLLETRTA